MDKEIVKHVILLREQSGLTQEAVARQLGISRQSWLQVEKGSRDLNTKELIAIADLFGVEVSDFFRNVTNVNKFRQMYLACIKFGSDNNDGGITKTKLAKLLYLADFTNFYNYLEPISGAKYKRLEYGPVADDFFAITEDLFDRGKISIVPKDQAFIVYLNTNNLSYGLLSSKELATIKKVCSAWKHKRTPELVNYTHEQKPWKMCRDGEYIPYSLILQEEPKNVYRPIR